MKVGAKNINKTPAWHAQPGEVTWLFIDEIEITAGVYPKKPDYFMGC